MNRVIPFQNTLSHFLMGAGLLAALPGPAAGQPSRAASSNPASTRAATARYAELDRVARELPDPRARTVPELAASLAAHGRTNNDKARLLFAWLAYHVAYDTEALRMGTRQPNCSPAAVLRSRRAVCQGYADLFTAVAREMKLPAQTVMGVGRVDGRGKVPGRAAAVPRAPGRAFAGVEATNHPRRYGRLRTPLKGRLILL